MSPAQVRAARAWLNWNQDVLAKKARVSKTTLNRFEQGLSILNSDTSDRIRKTLEEAGIRFQFRKMVGIGISIAPPTDSFE
ncbi:helix-turn-helix domain-containing protein [Bradyrhizobium sp. ISRA464]|nr:MULTISPECIES: helix-turn-helix transcriptional regulator [unclassified Bradyrhizobium]WGS24107.1 helix-turn-helix domain-containing protein [Bradyrhizobium sp. ISRA463]WGS31414.1 helix-turn-helix domain-containing protein [Bradyrhizobium sp. ISRA464]